MGRYRQNLKKKMASKQQAMVVIMNNNVLSTKDEIKGLNIL